MPSISVEEQEQENINTENNEEENNRGDVEVAIPSVN